MFKREGTKRRGFVWILWRSGGGGGGGGSSSSGGGGGSSSNSSSSQGFKKTASLARLIPASASEDVDAEGSAEIKYNSHCRPVENATLKVKSAPIREKQSAYP
jgi:hypothetical protein